MTPHRPDPSCLDRDYLYYLKYTSSLLNFRKYLTFRAKYVMINGVISIVTQSFFTLLKKFAVVCPLKDVRAQNVPTHRIVCLSLPRRKVMIYFCQRNKKKMGVTDFVLERKCAEKYPKSEKWASLIRPQCL